MVKDSRPKTVFRGMHLSPQEVKVIKEQGLVPEGLRKFGTLFRLLEAMIRANLEGKDPTFGYLESPELRLFISKPNILLNLWQIGEIGNNNASKLGMSATSLKEAERRGGHLWGDHLLEIKLPSNRIIAGSLINDEDESSILYYIEPRSIVGIYDQKDPDYKRIVQSRFNKLKPNIFSRMLGN